MEHMTRSKTVVLLVYSLFTLLSINEYAACKGEIKQLLDALSCILGKINSLKKSVLDLIHYQ